MPGNLPMIFQFVRQAVAQINHELTIDWYSLFISSPAGVRYLGDQAREDNGSWFSVPDTGVVQEF